MTKQGYPPSKTRNYSAKKITVRGSVSIDLLDAKGKKVLTIAANSQEKANKIIARWLE